MANSSASLACWKGAVAAEAKGTNAFATSRGALFAAAANGQSSTVEALLADGRAAASGRVPVALFCAVENGHAEVVRLLVNFDAFGALRDGTTLIGLAVRAGHAAVVRVLLTHLDVGSIIGTVDLLDVAAAHGHAQLISTLLAVEGIDKAWASSNSCAALSTAVARGHVEVVEQLLEDERCQRFVLWKHAVEAATRGNSALLQLLLIYVGETSAKQHGELLLAAATAGHSAVVAALLSLARFTPAAAVAGKALVIAAAHGHAAVVDALLSHDGTGSVACILHGGKALLAAARTGKAGIVKRLLQDKRIDPAEHGREALLHAVKCNDVAVAALLLPVARISLRGTIVQAVESGHVAVLQQLLHAVSMRNAVRRDDDLGVAAPPSKESHDAAAGCAASAASGRVLPVDNAAPTTDGPPAAALGCESALECVTASEGKARTSSSAAGAGLAAYEDLEDHVPELNAALLLAARTDNMAVVRTLLAASVAGINMHIVSRLDVCTGHYAVFRAAGRAGDAALLDRLLALLCVDVTDAGYAALCGAAKRGHLALVERLLADPRISPAHMPNACSIGSDAFLARNADAMAAKRRAAREVFTPGYADHAVELLEREEGGQLAMIERKYLAADESIFEDDPLTLAAQHGHIAIVERLLADPRVDPSVRGEKSAIAAAVDGYDASRCSTVAVLQRLLADPRVDADDGVRTCVEGSNDAALRVMLQFPSVELGRANNQALRFAAATAQPKVLELLLGDPRVDPLVRSSKGKSALDEALKQCVGKPTACANAVRLLHQPCVLRACVAARWLPFKGPMEAVRVSARQLQALAWRRRMPVVAAHPLCRGMAGLEVPDDDAE